MQWVLKSMQIKGIHSIKPNAIKQQYNKAHCIGVVQCVQYTKAGEADSQPTQSLHAIHFVLVGASLAQRKEWFLYFKNMCHIYSNPGVCKDLLLVIFHESHECFLEPIYSRKIQKRKLLPDRVFFKKKIVTVAFCLNPLKGCFQNQN